MRLSIQKASEASLALFALLLIAALIVPWRQSNPTEAPAKTASELSPNPAGTAAEPIRATPDTLFNLFAGKAAATPSAAVPKPAAVTATKKPVDAPWLRYIGNISGAEGKSYYFFKDTRSGRSVTLSAGETINGWSLVEIADNKFILKNNEDLYTVNKR
jgi:hypothetical protein